MCGSRTSYQKQTNLMFCHARLDSMWLIYILTDFNPLNLLENSHDKQNTTSVQFIPE